jgi:hypothetical protein
MGLNWIQLVQPHLADGLLVLVVSLLAWTLVGFVHVVFVVVVVVRRKVVVGGGGFGVGDGCLTPLLTALSLGDLLGLLLILCVSDVYVCVGWGGGRR